MSAARHAASPVLDQASDAVVSALIAEAANLSSLYELVCQPLGLDPTPRMVGQAFAICGHLARLGTTQPPPLENRILPQ